MKDSFSHRITQFNTGYMSTNLNLGGCKTPFWYKEVAKSSLLHGVLLMYLVTLWSWAVTALLPWFSLFCSYPSLCKLFIWLPVKTETL